MKKIKIFCDNILAIYAILWLFMCVGTMLGVTIYWATHAYGINKDFIEILIILIIGTALAFGIFIWCAPIWFAYVELDSEGISLHKGFKKTPKEKYESYGYFKVASYQHIFSTRYFVVMGKKGLTPFELVHINSVRVSEEIIKIKLSKKTKKLLMEFLPEWQKNILINSDEVINSQTYAKMLKRKEKARKKKSKWKNKKN